MDFLIFSNTTSLPLLASVSIICLSMILPSSSTKHAFIFVPPISIPITFAIFAFLLFFPLILSFHRIFLIQTLFLLGILNLLFLEILAYMIIIFDYLHRTYL